MEAQAKILRIRDVMSAVGLKKTAIYDKIKEGEFPKPVKLGSRASGWVAGEVQAWVEQRKEARA